MTVADLGECGVWAPQSATGHNYFYTGNPGSALVVSESRSSVT